MLLVAWCCFLLPLPCSWARKTQRQNTRLGGASHCPSNWSFPTLLFSLSRLVALAAYLLPEKHEQRLQAPSDQLGFQCLVDGRVPIELRVPFEFASSEGSENSPSQRSNTSWPRKKDDLTVSISNQSGSSLSCSHDMRITKSQNCLLSLLYLRV